MGDETFENQYKFLRHLSVNMDISQFIIIDKCYSFYCFFYMYSSCGFALMVTEFSLVHTRMGEQIGLVLSFPSQGWNLPTQVLCCFSFQKYKWRRVTSCILSSGKRLRNRKIFLKFSLTENYGQCRYFFCEFCSQEVFIQKHAFFPLLNMNFQRQTPQGREVFFSHFCHWSPIRFYLLFIGMVSPDV